MTSATQTVKRWLITLAFTATFAASPAVAIAAIDFNGMNTTSPSAAPIVVDGFRFSSTFQSIVNPAIIGFDGGVENGTNFLVFEQSGVLTIDRVDGGRFSLNSLDVGAWWNVPNGTALTISSIGLGGAITTLTPVTSLSPSAFSSIATGTGFSDVFSVKMNFSVSPANLAAYAAIDNLALAPVPEPESIAMFSAGLALLAATLRRRTRADFRAAQ